jgi:hypothetical protein
MRVNVRVLARIGVFCWRTATTVIVQLMPAGRGQFYTHPCRFSVSESRMAYIYTFIDSQK